MTGDKPKLFRTSSRFWVGLLLVFWVPIFVWPVQADAAERKRKNPFSLPKGIYYRSTGVTVPKPVLSAGTPMTLQAVVLGGPERVAIINGQNYVVGDLAFGKAVLSIDPEKVVLKGKIKNMILQLNRPFFPIAVSPGP